MQAPRDKKGTMEKALRNGEWVLLDEIKLATAETLECISGSRTIVLDERGDCEPSKRHPEFRIFACMNPATDVGKTDLPIGLGNRFTEFHIIEMEAPTDLFILVRDYLQGVSISSEQVSGIVKFYQKIKKDPNVINETGHKGHFSKQAVLLIGNDQTSLVNDLAREDRKCLCKT